MKEKEIKREVKLLAKQKEFERIYQEYGPAYFREYVSRKYKKEDIAKLRQEGKYLDIYVKYGKTYKEVYRKDIENELGRKSTLPERVLNKNFALRQVEKLKKGLRSTIIYVVTTFSSFTMSCSGMAELEKVINSQKYAKEIDEYENEIKEYAKKFNIHTQSDMEIIMRLMKDMHETMIGYGEPKIDAVGYWGMDVMDENGIGVCRNMAGNFVDKLNEINPEYNARIVSLYAEFGELEESIIEHNIIHGNTRINIIGNIKSIYIDGQLTKNIIKDDDITIINEFNENGNVHKTIKRTEKETEEILYDEKNHIVEERKTVIEQKKNGKVQKVYSNGKLISENRVEYEEIREDDSQNEKELIKKILGNHAIVAVDIKSDNVTLLIDPTNPSLGVYKDGKIKIFNEKKPELAIYDRKIIKYNLYEGIDGLFKCSTDYLESFREPTISMKELEKNMD